MKIITIAMNKGGTGKSTIAFNLGKWLSDPKKQNKKVLMIDGDYSCNLSYSIKHDYSKSNIKDVFEDKEVDVHHINDNLDFLEGNEELKDDELDIKSRPMNVLVFYMWAFDNEKWLSQYDYIVIDTHNDESTITQNFVAVSDLVIGVTDPSRNGFRAWLDLEELIDLLKKHVYEPKSRESYVNAEPYLIMNSIDTRSNTGKEYLDAAKAEKRCLGVVKDRDLMKQSLAYDKSIFELYDGLPPSKQANVQDIIDNVEGIYEKIIALVNK